MNPTGVYNVGKLPCQKRQGLASWDAKDLGRERARKGSSREAKTVMKDVDPGLGGRQGTAGKGRV